MEEITQQEIYDRALELFDKYKPKVESITVEKLEDFSKYGISREYLVNHLAENVLAEVAGHNKDMVIKNSISYE